MLVSAKEMVANAYAGHYAIGAFNLNNLEWTKSVLKAAQETNSPVIVQVSEGAGKYMAGFKTVKDIVADVIESQGITVPVALHLDHGTYEGCKKCIDAGFTSIMFDGSALPFEENVEKTKELVAICNEKGMSIEAEVGAIGGEEDGVVGAGECADPEECKKIADLGISMLAAGIGNIHGVYPENWPGLRFDVLEAIKAAVGAMPLVLHGGSGIPDLWFRMQSSSAFPRSMLIQSASLHLLRLHVSISKQARICRARASIRESFWLRAQLQSQIWLSTRSKYSVLQTRLDRIGINDCPRAA